MVGDDLTVTNSLKIKRAIDDKACNALLLKVNQIGSVTESIEAVRCGAGGSSSRAVRNGSRAAGRQKRLARDARPRPAAGDDGAGGGVGRDDQPPLGRDQPSLTPCHFSRAPLPSPFGAESRCGVARPAGECPLRRVRSHFVFGLSLKRQCLGFGCVFVSEIEAPNMLLNLVHSGCVVAQRDNATEPEPSGNGQARPRTPSSPTSPSASAPARSRLATGGRAIQAPLSLIYMEKHQ